MRNVQPIDPDGSSILLSSGGRRYAAALTHWPAVRLPVGDGGAVRAEGITHSGYGGRASFIVDMQGIDAFLFGRAKLFRDETARQAAVALGLIDAGRAYLRVGAAGAPPLSYHPGGEVLECSLLHGPRLAGRSWTVSGFLPAGRAFSRAAELRAPGSRRLMEARSVYSHTAFLTEEEPAAPHSVRLSLAGEPGGLDVLAAVDSFVREHKLSAYAIRVFVEAFRPADPPVVTGRVLKRLPHRRLRCVREATDIASEQTFTLRPGQRLRCFGTNYPRVTPDWAAFRGGKPYEPLGHLHMAVGGAAAGGDQHAVSHLRRLLIMPGGRCEVLLTPVTRTVHIEPVVVRGEEVVSRCSGRVTAVIDGEARGNGDGNVG